MRLGPIHVGPGGLWLVIFGVVTVLLVEPVDAPAIVMRCVALAGAAIGAASALIWFVLSSWQHLFGQSKR